MLQLPSYTSLVRCVDSKTKIIKIWLHKFFVLHLQKKTSIGLGLSIWARRDTSSTGTWVKSWSFLKMLIFIRYDQTPNLTLSLPFPEWWEQLASSSMVNSLEVDSQIEFLTSPISNINCETPFLRWTCMLYDGRKDWQTSFRGESWIGLPHFTFGCACSVCTSLKSQDRLGLFHKFRYANELQRRIA